MEDIKIKESIQALCPDAQFVENKQFIDVSLPLEHFRKVMEYLKQTLNFNFLVSVSGVDWEKHFAVVYHLRNTQTNTMMAAKVIIADRQNPEVPTVSDLWQTADLHEREIFDLFGIKFTNHPDLRRLFLDDDWVGFPLRKDYVDTVNIVER